MGRQHHKMQLADLDLAMPGNTDTTYGSVAKLPAGMAKWQLRASRLSHFFLYFFLVSMPVTGYLGSGGGVNYGLFQVPAFRRTGWRSWFMETFELTRQQFEAPFDFYHYKLVGPFILLPLILLHAGAALYHHFVRKDDVLRRMLPGTKSDE